MPFDPAPQVKTIFQEFADAMLRGCAAVGPSDCLFDDGVFGKVGACAIGAAAIGMGAPLDWMVIGRMVHSDPRFRDVDRAYGKRYKSNIRSDNDQNGLTREQIAARIAAL